MRLFPLLVAVTFASAPLAGATGPVPSKEVYVDQDISTGFAREGIFEKQEEIPEHCTPRPLVLCAGPYDPDWDVHWGMTGFAVRTNGTNLTAIHDPARHWEYGPYYIEDVLLDDLRLCTSGCQVPNSVYGHAETNLTVVVWVLGEEQRVDYHVQRREIGVNEPGVISRECKLYPRWYDCTTLL